MKYEIDTDTRACLEETLQMAQRFVDLQLDDAIASDCQLILNTLAEAFGIEQTELIVETDDDGTITITQATDDQSKRMTELDGGVSVKPKLTVVSDNTEPTKP